MVGAVFRALALSMAIAAMPAAPLAQTTCDQVTPAPGAEAKDARAGRASMHPETLVQLRDIGSPEVVMSDQTPLALSPDKRVLAFVVSRADSARNRICTELVSLPVDQSRLAKGSVSGTSPVRILDHGGPVPRLAGVFRGLYITTGFPQVITPAWSPDGKWVAYRKLIDGIVQVVRARADGGGAEIATRSGSDVESFAWSNDGSEITYQTRLGRLEADRRTVAAGRSGWLYDASVLPQVSWKPQPWAKDMPLEAFTVTLVTGDTRPASEAQSSLLKPVSVIGYAYSLAVESGSGGLATTRPVSANPEADQRLWASLPGGEARPCMLAQCSGKIVQAWWSADRKSVVFLKRQGWNNEEWAIHRWEPASGKVSLVLHTLDALTGCVNAASQLICGRENARMPRRIVSIDLATGVSTTLYDPNPEFAHLDLGEVRRLRWKNDLGLPSWGDLVLPPGYDGRKKLPMVIVQYRSLGFLRGGTGDDYPIYPLAAKGFAVLSLERPRTVSSVNPTVTNWEQALSVQWKDWADRRSIFSALDHGIDAAVATGFVDAGRVGVSGLSDGVSTIEFGLVNSRRFAAAAISTCCDDMLTSLVLGGFAWGDQNRRVGFPAFVDNDREFWKPLSLSVNARSIDTPILMQVADRETLLALPAFGALREAGKPVELYVYPDEYHNKWQPAHRLAVYERAMDWFDFWLHGRRDPSPAKREQYQRWDALRAAREGRSAVSSP